MKSDLDRFMQEYNVDALWVIGAMNNNPDMVYFTGIQHVNRADLIKLRGKEPVIFHQVTMEREEASRSGLETHAYDDDHPLRSYLTRNNGDLAHALADRTKDVFEEIGLVKGRVAISGRENLAYAFGIIEKVKQIMPEIEFFQLHQ